MVKSRKVFIQGQAIGNSAYQAGEARQKLYSLEAGRFIAALLVLLCHTGLYLGHHTAPGMPYIFGGAVFPGQLGVQFFFVLSGFVMVSAHHQDFGSIKAIPKFWWRRACRIYPAYWLALCIPAYYAWSLLTPGSAASYALLDPWHSDELILAAWTLRYEFVFYLLLGLAMFPYIGKPLLAFWIFFTFWRWSLLNVLGFHPPVLFIVNHFVVDHADKFAAIFEIYFFLGLAAGFIHTKCRLDWRVLTALLAGGGLAVCYLVPLEGWGSTYGSPGETVVMSCALGAVVLGLAGLERQGKIRPGRVAGWLGAVSYPLYVLHMPVMVLTDNVLRWGMFSTRAAYVHFFLLNAGILVLSVLAAFLFDQPVQRALRRLTRRIWRNTAATPLAPCASVTEAG